MYLRRQLTLDLLCVSQCDGQASCIRCYERGVPCFYGLSRKGSSTTVHPSLTKSAFTAMNPITTSPRESVEPKNQQPAEPYKPLVDHSLLQTSPASDHSRHPRGVILRRNSMGDWVPSALEDRLVAPLSTLESVDHGLDELSLKIQGWNSHFPLASSSASSTPIAEYPPPGMSSSESRPSTSDASGYPSTVSSLTSPGFPLSSEHQHYVPPYDYRQTSYHPTGYHLHRHHSSYMSLKPPYRSSSPVIIHSNEGSLREMDPAGTRTVLSGSFKWRDRERIGHPYALPTSRSTCAPTNLSYFPRRVSSPSGPGAPFGPVERRTTFHELPFSSSPFPLPPLRGSEQSLSAWNGNQPAHPQPLPQHSHCFPASLPQHAQDPQGSTNLVWGQH